MFPYAHRKGQSGHCLNVTSDRFLTSNWPSSEMPVRPKVRFAARSGLFSEIASTQVRGYIRSGASLSKLVAFEDLGARVNSPGVRNDQLPVLSLQEGSSELARPDDKVPQAIKSLNHDVH
jgi:hypothetical protein